MKCCGTVVLWYCGSSNSVQNENGFLKKYSFVLCKDEIYGLIDEMPEMEANPVNGRLAPIIGVPRSQDYRRLIARMKSVS